MQFSRDYLVHYYEAGPDRKLTLPSLVRYFEDIAILHSSSLGLDLAWYERETCGWMLLKWDISVERMPEFGETVRLGTKVHAMRSFMADRDFELRDASGALLSVGRSNWLLVDTVRRRPLRVQESQYSAFGVPPETSALFRSLGDLDFSVEGADPHPVRAMDRDIDTNGHVNNVSYLEWALDSLPAGFARQYSPAAVRVQYRKELGPGSPAEVFSVLQTAGAAACDQGAGPVSSAVFPGGVSTSRHTVRSDGADCCLVEIDWKPAG